MVVRATGVIAAAAILALASTLDTARAAEVYKWVDDDGVTHYTQEPPPDREAQQMGVEPRPSRGEIERAKRDMEQTEQALEERREQRREAERRAAEEQREQARIERRCKELRASIENLVQNRQLLTSDGEGGYERLPEEQRKERLAKRREEFRENCES